MARPPVPINNYQTLVPVKRIAFCVDGVETYEYAYIPYTVPADAYEPIPEPLPDTVVWLPTQDTPPAGYIAWTMIQSDMGGIKAGKGKGAMCVSCGSQFPLTDMAKIRGKWYCNQNGCAEDQR